jgi:hypothetical protein
MDMLKKLSMPAQAVLAGVVLYIIFSFFDWQQACFGPVCAGVSEWHGGGGTITVLSAFLLLAWELVRLLNVKVNVGGIAPGLISFGLTLLLLLLTIITFLTHNEARHWPAWIGLILAIVIAGAGYARSKEEGVEMSHFGTLASSVSSSVQSAVQSREGESSSTTAAPAPAAPEPPPAPPSEPPAVSGDEPAPSA